MKTQVRLFSALALVVASFPTLAHAQLFEEQPGALTQGCNGAGCWTNYARMTDIDGDGDLDLIGVNNDGFFVNPEAQELSVWTNDGDGGFTAANSMFGALVVPARQIAIGDIDFDGDADVFIPSAGNEADDILLVQTAPGVFADESAERLPAGLSSDAGFTRFGDLDSDGDLDLIVGDGYMTDGAPPVHLYFNNGGGILTESDTTYPQDMDGVNPDDVDLADVDGDFDLDLLINAHEGQNALWLNDGAGNFTEAPLPALNEGAFHYGPVFCDADGDSDLDMFVDNAGTTGFRHEHFSLNNGDGSFTDATKQLAGNGSTDDNLVACLDHDDDGDFDIIIGSLQTNERVLQNDGSGNFTQVANAQNGAVDPTLWLELGDVDGDGRLDMFTAQGEGFPETEQLYLGGDSIVDTRAPKLRAAEAVAPSAGEERPLRFALSDNATTDEGPRLRRAYVVVGGQEVDATFMGGDLFRAYLPAVDAETYQICATDWAGNNGCTEVTGEPGEGGGGAGGGGEGGAAQGGAAQGGSPSANGGSNEGGASGGGAADGDGDSGDGCSCSVPGQRPARDLSGMLLGVLALGLVIMRGRSKR